MLPMLKFANFVMRNFSGYVSYKDAFEFSIREVISRSHLSEEKKRESMTRAAEFCRAYKYIAANLKTI